LGDSSFIRDRVFSFEKLVIYQLQRSSGSITKELTSFFSNCLDDYLPTKSAYSKARKKLSSSCYDALNMGLLKKVDPPSLWKGHRVRGIDGTTVQLPYSKSCISTYGTYNIGQGDKESCMARVSILCDISSKLILSESFDHYRVSEKDQFHHHQQHIEANDILLLDGYYDKASILDSILCKGADFVVPLTAKRHIVRRFIKHKRKKEILTDITFTDSKTKEPFLLHGRLMKKKINGNYKVIFTSLTDKDYYSHKSLFDLYTQRWEVEICYLHLKNGLELADWTSTSVLGIQQDFKAKILLYNLTRMLMHRLKPPRKKRDKRNKPTLRKRVISFSNAISQCRSALIKLIKGKVIKEIIQHFIEKTINNVEYSRKGQSNSRSPWKGKRFHINQKSA